MRRVCPLLMLSLACGVAAAAPGSATRTDTLGSDACRAALAELDQRERALDTAAADRSAWQQERRQAALACLGREDAPPAQHLAQPPVRVAPVVVPPAPRPRIDVPPPSSPAPAAPPTVTSCDALGCWASDGTRWQRNGPDLVGPRGVCVMVGQQVRCP